MEHAFEVVEQLRVHVLYISISKIFSKHFYRNVHIIIFILGKFSSYKLGQVNHAICRGYRKNVLKFTWYVVLLKLTT